MCTVIIDFKPGDPWPLLLAGNRDEMYDRPADPPARHWPQYPDVIAGRDHLAGGSWLGMNDRGMVAVILNREGSLGPQPGKRSRGELVLQVLDSHDPPEAIATLSELDPDHYRPFNLVIADATQAWWVCLRESQPDRLAVQAIAPGLHMLSASELDDQEHPRIRTWLPKFRAATRPEPHSGHWTEWQTLLASRIHPQELGPRSAMNLDLEIGFGTVSSTLLALPAPGSSDPVHWLFANGAPDRTPFRPVYR